LGLLQNVAAKPKGLKANKIFNNRKEEEVPGSSEGLPRKRQLTNDFRALLS